VIGQFLLRTLDLARRIHLAMLSRDCDGKIHLTRPLQIRSQWPKGQGAGTGHRLSPL
jgi:hypothetical protein